MTEPNTTARTPDDLGPAAANLPADVLAWLDATLAPDERAYACLFADILPTGAFGERWVFLTDRRLFVLAGRDALEGAATVLDLPLTQIQGARLEHYVGSSALILSDAEQGHEVARFTQGSHHEAADLGYYLNALVKGRAKGLSFAEIPQPFTVRPSHRCSTCGRALSRWREVCPDCIDHRKIIARLLGYLMPYRWMALGGLLLTFTITGLQLMPPYLNKVLIDDVIIPGNAPLLPVVVAVYVLISVSAAALSMLRTYVIRWVGQQILFDLRVGLFSHLQMLRLRFYSQRQTGRIMSRLTSDLTRLQQLIADNSQEFLINVATMILIAAILLAMNWRLFLIALAPTPVIALSTWLFGRRMHMIYHRIWRRSAGLNAILADTIPGIRVVKAFAQEKRETERFSESSKDLLGQEMHAIKVSSAFFPFLDIQTTLGSILIFSIGGYMVMRGEATVGTLVAFTSYLWRFYRPVQQIGHMNHRLQHSLTSAERVFEILDADPEPLLQGGRRIEPLRGGVDFQEVRFSYEPGKYALDGISFCVEPGEMIGLVGPSGAGKSTLVHLLARFYELDEGRILIDGVDVQELDLRWFRQQIGVVLQEPYLFHGSVWSNIAYAQPDASADAIIAAARAANAHDFIVRMPDGYDTVIGERGQTLSGGERQRLSIARAVLRNPRILILDEATASVDTETESLIQTALERLVQNRTTFAIAHRLSTLRKANRLVVLERSKLVEIGTHNELIAADGRYARLCRLQAEMSRIKAV